MQPSVLIVSTASDRADARAISTAPDELGPRSHPLAVALAAAGYAVYTDDDAAPSGDRQNFDALCVFATEPLQAARSEITRYLAAHHLERLPVVVLLPPGAMVEPLTRNAETLLWECFEQPVAGAQVLEALNRLTSIRLLLRENTSLKETNRAQREELARLVAVRTAQVRDTRHALELTQERLRGLAANVPGVLFQFDPGAQGAAPSFLYVSERSTEMLGVSPEEAMRRRDGPLDAFHPDDRAAFFDQIRQAETNGQDAVSWQGRHIGGLGSVRWFELNARLDNRAAGTWAALLVDITDRKELQARVMQSDRLASLGILAAGVAHEINNPLTYTLSNLQLAQEAFPEGTPGANLLADALDGAKRVAVIARNLKAFSRPEAEEMELVDLVAALESSLRIAVNAVRFRAKLERDVRKVPRVLGNSARIGQVFLNLLINAAQSFDAPDSDQNLIRVRCFTDPLGDACVEIIDNGPGIPDALLPRIFDPFVSTKQQRDGTGLGLYICRDIVTGYRGTLAAESRVGQGATFRVRFPAAAVQTATPHTLPRAVAARTRLRILVADDEPMIARSLQRLLAEHDVEVAANGRIALDALRERTFDLVLCDLMMPTMDGVDLYRTLEGLDHPIRHRMVFMTGGAFTERARQFLLSIKNPTLDKPLEPSTLNGILLRFAAESASA